MLARSIQEGHGYRWYFQTDLEQLRPYLSQFLDYSKLDLPEYGLVTTFRPPGYPPLLALIYTFSPRLSVLPLHACSNLSWKRGWLQSCSCWRAGWSAATVGIWTLRRKPEALLAALLVIGYALPHILIIAEPRYHLALVPVLIPFAVQGWVEGLRVMRSPLASWNGFQRNLKSMVAFSILAMTLMVLIFV